MPKNPLVEYPFLNAFTIAGGGWELPEAKDSKEGTLFLLMQSQIGEDGTKGTTLEPYIFDGTSWKWFRAPQIKPHTPTVN
jgi:hypothetical protein